MSRYHLDLVREIETFTSGHDMPETTFGRRAMGDPHFVRDIRRDRCLRPESVERVRRFMGEYSPTSDAPSPGNIAQQSPSIEEAA